MSDPKILIVFYSRNHATEALAVADGARASRAEVRLRRAREFVGRAVMANVPGWSDNAAAMNVFPIAGRPV